MKEQEIKEVAEVALAEKQTFVVFDEDSQQNVKITPAMRDEALSVHNRIQGALFEIASALHEIQEKRLYLAMGFSSFKDYYTSYGFSRSSVYRQKRIGEKFPTWGTLDEKTEQLLQSLGAHKLYEFTRLSQDQVKLLLEGNSIDNGNGESIDLEEFKSSTVSEVSKKVSSILQPKDKKEINKIKADNELLKAEKKALLKKIERMEQDVKDARELEAKYGPKERSLKAKRASLNEATTALGKFYTALNSAGIEADDPIEVIDVFTALVTSIEQYVDENRARFWMVIKEAKNEL